MMNMVTVQKQITNQRVLDVARIQGRVIDSIIQLSGRAKLRSAFNMIRVLAEPPLSDSEVREVLRFRAVELRETAKKQFENATLLENVAKVELVVDEAGIKI